MKEKDIREIEDTVYEVFRKENRFYLLTALVFVFSIFLGASLAIMVSKM